MHLLVIVLQQALGLLSSRKKAAQLEVVRRHPNQGSHAQGQQAPGSESSASYQVDPRSIGRMTIPTVGGDRSRAAERYSTAGKSTMGKATVGKAPPLTAALRAHEYLTEISDR